VPPGDNKPDDAMMRSILITGASSGIGEALALEYAEPGVALALGGRNAERLEAVAAACRARGAEVEVRVGDVRDRAAMAAWIEAVDDRRPLDLVIANAGIASSGQDASERTYAVFAVNVGGVFHTALPALARMRARGRGQIAIMSSLSAWIGLPSSVDYTASKAAVRVWGEALRRRHGRHGVRVSVVCPGFVTSRMTGGNRFRMPLLWPADRAARAIRRGLERNRGLIAFPWPLRLAVYVGALLPSRLADFVAARLPRKS
jgi:short-subunit dehydrogenase